jgi:ankyrin repeat protein
MKTKKRPNAQQLYAAIRRHDVALLRTLLSDGADANAAVHDDYHGDIPVLLCAAGAQFFEGVKALLDAGANPNAVMTGGEGGAGAETVLNHAITGSDNRPYDDPKRSTEEDRLKIVDLLLKAGADPNAVSQGDTLPLYDAARSGYFEICHRLIEAGATFKTWPPGCMPPLTGAVNFGNAPEGQKQDRIAELLLELGAPVDGETATGLTALMTAATGGSEHLVNLYLTHGADVNHRSEDARAPLHCAAVFARDAATERQRELALRIVKKLVEAGADPNAKNADGETAYDIASRFRASPAAEYLKTRSIRTT